MTHNNNEGNIDGKKGEKLMLSLNLAVISI